MKALLLKDFYLLCGYCRSMLFIFVAFLMGSLGGNSFFCFYPVIIVSMLPSSLLSYDERDKWNIYSDTLPYTRAQLVSSKYLLSLLISAAAIIIVAILQGARVITTQDFSMGEYQVLIGTSLMLSLLAPALMLPTLYRFGAEKGRMIYLGIIALLIGGVTALSIIAESSDLFTALMVSLSQLHFAAILAVILLIAAVLYLLSWRLSIRFYEKKEL